MSELCGPSGERATHSAIHGMTTDEAESWFQTLARTVAVDFDGTLHPYTDGWTGSVPEDEPPIPGAKTFVAWLINDGFDVVIFSTRADHDDGRVGIEQWLAKWFGYGIAAQLRVTHEKPPAVAYVDDRAVPVDPSDPEWEAVLARVHVLAAGRPHGAAR